MKKHGQILACIILLCFGMAAAGCAPEKKNEKITLRVAAAASLEKVFVQKLIPLYEKNNPNVKIEGVYDASGKLQTQIENGLAAAIFISAANKQMNILAEKNFIAKDSVMPLLENKLVLIVPQKNNGEIKSFADFIKAQHPAVGDPASVPAGQYAREALTHLKIWDAVAQKASFGTNVTQVLNWVGEGSADAGLVYATDAALLKNKVRIIADSPQGSLKKKIIYPFGILAQSKNKKEAQALAKFLQSEEAEQIFAEYGFARAK